MSIVNLNSVAVGERADKVIPIAVSESIYEALREKTGKVFGTRGISLVTRALVSSYLRGEIHLHVQPLDDGEAVDDPYQTYCTNPGRPTKDRRIYRVITSIVN